MSNIDMLKMFGELFFIKNMGQYHDLYLSQTCFF